MENNLNAQDKQWAITVTIIFFLGDIFWLFPAVMLQQIGVGSDTKTDAGQPEQN